MVRHARRGFVPFVVVVAVIALAAPALGTPAGSDTSRHPRRSAEVKISRDVRLGQFSEMRVRLWARCRSPLIVQELLIDVSQAGLSGSFTGDFGIICDGTWQQVRTSVSTPGGGPFEPGLTTVTATLTVIDPVTGDPAPQGQDSITVFVHSQAEVKISRNVRLGQGGAMLVSVWVRCEIPWVRAELSSGSHRMKGSIVGRAPFDFGIVCDDRWHRIDVQVFSSGELVLGGGLTRVDASLDVQDPIDFDPVDQATDSVTVWVRAPAEVRIFSARRGERGRRGIHRRSGALPATVGHRGPFGQAHAGRRRRAWAAPTISGSRAMAGGSAG